MTTPVQAVTEALEVHQVEFIDWQVGWDCGCNERGYLPGMPTLDDALRHQAEAAVAAAREPIIQGFLATRAPEPDGEVLPAKEYSSQETAERVRSHIEALAATGDDGTVPISTRAVAAELSIGRQTASRALALLVDTGQIQIVRHGTGNEYPTTYRVEPTPRE